MDVFAVFVNAFSFMIKIIAGVQRDDEESELKLLNMILKEVRQLAGKQEEIYSYLQVSEFMSRYSLYNDNVKALSLIAEKVVEDPETNMNEFKQKSAGDKSTDTLYFAVVDESRSHIT